MTRSGAAEIAAYLAATVAEGYDTDRGAARTGSGSWWRPPSWFRDLDGHRPPHHVRIPLAERTLKRGLAALRDDGWIEVRRMTVNPETGNRLQRPRNFYTNRFIERAQESAQVDVTLRRVVEEADDGDLMTLDVTPEELRGIDDEVLARAAARGEGA